MGEAAARVVWKCTEHAALAARLTSDAGFQLVQPASSEPGTPSTKPGSLSPPVSVVLLNNLMRRTKSRAGALDNACHPYFYHNLGALLSLASSPSGGSRVRDRVVDHAEVLLQMCVRGGHIETLKLAAEGLCRILATSRKARRLVAGSEAIPRISHLLLSDNT